MARPAALGPMKATAARQMRATAQVLDTDHPETIAGDHLRDAARVLEHGSTEGARRHLDAAMELLTPQSLRRHGILDDEGHVTAKHHMHQVHRHRLHVEDIEEVGQRNDQLRSVARALRGEHPSDDDVVAEARLAVELSARTAMLERTPAPRGRPGGPGLYAVKGLGHTPYLQQIVKALIEKRGMSSDKAYAIARGAIRKWMRGGAHAHPEVVAAAGRAEAGELARQARARASHGHAITGQQAIELVGPKGYSHGWVFHGIPAIGTKVRMPGGRLGTVIGGNQQHARIRTANGDIFKIPHDKGPGPARLVKDTSKPEPAPFPKLSPERMKMKLAADKSIARGETLFHGTNHQFKPGDIIDAQHSRRGVTMLHEGKQYAFASTDPGEATFAGRVRREGHVYRVEPVGQHEYDPHQGSATSRRTSGGFRVVEEVQQWSGKSMADTAIGPWEVADTLIELACGPVDLVGPGGWKHGWIKVGTPEAARHHMTYVVGRTGDREEYGLYNHGNGTVTPRHAGYGLKVTHIDPGEETSVHDIPAERARAFRTTASPAAREFRRRTKVSWASQNQPWAARRYGALGLANETGSVIDLFNPYHAPTGQFTTASGAGQGQSKGSKQQRRRHLIRQIASIRSQIATLQAQLPTPRKPGKSKSATPAKRGAAATSAAQARQAKAANKQPPGVAARKTASVAAIHGKIAALRATLRADLAELRSLR